MTEKNIGELGKRRLFKNLLDKVAAGKTLTANERRQYDELADIYGNNTDQQQESGQSSLVVPLPVVAQFFKVSAQTVCNWADKGMPKLKHGHYDLCKAFDWWKINIDGDNPTAGAMQDHKVRYWKEMADSKEIENLTSRGLLIAKDEVIDHWTARIAVVRQSLLTLPARLPAILEGKNPQSMRQIIHDEVTRILEDYARGGKYCETEKAAKPAKPAKRKGK